MIRIIIVIALALGAFLLYIAFEPSHYSIARAVEIDRSAAEIFPYLNNPKLMNEWAPWKEIDPQIQMSYSGSESGVGAKASWTSEGKMGVGSALIINSSLDRQVRTKLEYEKPMKMVQEALMSIEAQGSKSKVTWMVEGENTFMGRLLCFFMNMDKQIGGMFEKGLGNLKATL